MACGRRGRAGPSWGPEPSGASRATGQAVAAGRRRLQAPHSRWPLPVRLRLRSAPEPHHTAGTLPHLCPADGSRRFRKRHVRHPPRPAPCRWSGTHVLQNLGPEWRLVGGARAATCGGETPMRGEQGHFSKGKSSSEEGDEDRRPQLSEPALLGDSVGLRWTITHLGG